MPQKKTNQVVNSPKNFNKKKNANRKQKRRQLKKDNKKQIKTNSPDLVLTALMTPKQQVRDARRQTVNQLSESLDLKNQVKQISIVVPCTTDSLQAICAGYVSLALQRGWAAYSTVSSDPFRAYIYMYVVLQSYIGGKPPPCPTLPYWLLCLCQAIEPKTVPYQQGFASYSFRLSDVTFVPSVFSFVTGYSTYGSVFTLTQPGGSLVNGFPSAGANVTVGTLAEQQTAFENLIQYMNGTPTQAAGSNIVPVTKITKYVKDVSAFAANYLGEGLGFSNVGGWVSQAQQEVPIFTPLLSLLTSGSTAGNVLQNRFYNSCATVSGDGFWLSTMMSTLIQPNRFRMRRYPRFHAVDFLEFGDVMAQWVAGLIQEYVNDPEFGQVVAAQQGAEVKKKKVNAPFTDNWLFNAIPDPLCPLTLQEMLLLLRNVIMCAFKATQPGVQSLLPVFPASGSDNQFTPYVAGANCCAINILDMMLPTALIENIRALVAREIVINAPHDVQWYVPVLGQYALDTLDSEDYQINLSNYFEPEAAISSVNVFQDGVIFSERRLDTKGKVVDVALTETPISLIDGTAGGTAIWINDPMQLKRLVGLWNSWLTKFALQTYSMTLGTMGTELGISSLTSIAMTRHWITPPETLKVNIDKFSDPRMVAKMGRGVQTIYDAKLAVAESSQSIILAAPYEQILDSWILPVNRSQSGEQIDQQALFTRWQEIMGEPYSTSLSTGTDGLPLSFMHAVYASKMLKSRSAPPNGLDQFLIEQAKLGRGGILSGIGSALDSILGF